MEADFMVQFLVCFFYERRNMIKINGKDVPEAIGRTVSRYLDENGYKQAYIAVEVNGSILSKAEYDSYIINDDDVIEIVNFVGGG